jgi:hypothetical protein
VIIKPAKRICGSISLPGDKSISHRAAMLAALANGISRLTNYSTSADCAATLACLRDLGVRIDQSETEIHGVGKDGFGRRAENLIAPTAARALFCLPEFWRPELFSRTKLDDRCSRPGYELSNRYDGALRLLQTTAVHPQL